MDFELTKEQKDIQTAIREFAETELTAEVKGHLWMGAS